MDKMSSNQLAEQKFLSITSHDYIVTVRYKLQVAHPNIHCILPSQGTEPSCEATHIVEEIK